MKVLIRVLEVVLALQLFWSVVMKWVAPTGIPEHFAELGWALSTVRWVGVAELVATLLFLIPRFRLVGALLLSAYLGGAIAAHVRIGDWVALYPAALLAVCWLIAANRDPRVWSLFFAEPSELASSPR